MATHYSILAWRIPWTEEPGGLQSMGSQSDRTEWLTLSQIRTRLVEKSLQMKWQKEQTKTDRKLFWGGQKRILKTNKQKSFKPSMFLRQSEMILSSPDNVKNKTRENLWKFLKICLFWKKRKHRGTEEKVKKIFQSRTRSSQNWGHKRDSN